jgi:putative addiction module antidote
LFDTVPNLKEVLVVRSVRLRKMGGSVGATLPKDLAERLHLDVGDEVFVVETDQGLLITPYDPTFEKAMIAYRRGAKKYKNALRELAK